MHCKDQCVTQLVFISKSGGLFSYLNLCLDKFQQVEFCLMSGSCLWLTVMLCDVQGATGYDWHRILFSVRAAALHLFSFSSLLISCDSPIHSRSRKLIFSFNIPLSSILSNLPSRSVQPSLSLPGIYPKWPPVFTLDYVISSNTVLALQFVLTTLAQPANLHRCHTASFGRCADSTKFVWTEK